MQNSNSNNAASRESTHNICTFENTIQDKQINGCVLTDELLIEILLWLPVPCLYDFRRVSKKWREIISSSYFKELLRKRNKKLEERDLSSLLGFYVTECESKHAFLPTSSLIHRTTSDKRKGNALVPRGCSFIACSNGMLLFGNHRSQTYYLCNFTRQARILLPKPSYTRSNVAMDVILMM